MIFDDPAELSDSSETSFGFDCTRLVMAMYKFTKLQVLEPKDRKKRQLKHYNKQSDYTSLLEIRVQSLEEGLKIVEAIGRLEGSEESKKESVNPQSLQCRFSV